MNRLANYLPGISGREPEIQGWEEWEQSHDAETMWGLTDQVPEDDDDDEEIEFDEDDDEDDEDDDSDLEVKENE